MTERYRHTQTGYVTLAALIGAFVLVGYLAWAAEAGPIIYVVLAAVGVLALMFSTLTVVVTDKAVRLWFGPGWPRRAFPLADIEGVARVRNPWYTGWGVRLIPQRSRGAALRGVWVFNVSGFDAVELRMRNGRRFRIGTDDPDGLEQAIRLRLPPT